MSTSSTTSMINGATTAMHVTSPSLLGSRDHIATLEIQEWQLPTALFSVERMHLLRRRRISTWSQDTRRRRVTSGALRCSVARVQTHHVALRHVHAIDGIALGLGQWCITSPRSPYFLVEHLEGLVAPCVGCSCCASLTSLKARLTSIRGGSHLAFARFRCATVSYRFERVLAFSPAPAGQFSARRW